MISKTLGQLTQDETRLWELTFCSTIAFLSGGGGGTEGMAAEDADAAIAALRQYRAESEPKLLNLERLGESIKATYPTDPRDPPHEEAALTLSTEDPSAFFGGDPVEYRRRTDGPGFGTEGIIGTYDTLNKGWWLNGPTIPRFEPDPRFEEEKAPVLVADPGYTLSAPCAVDLMRTGRCVESVGAPRHKCRMSGERVISDYGLSGSDMGVKAWLGAYSDVRYRMCDCGCFPIEGNAP